MTFKQHSDLMRLIGNIEGAAMGLEDDKGSFIADTAAAAIGILDDVVEERNMNADKVEHRGYTAFQSVYNNHVLIKHGDDTVRNIVTDGRRRSAEELKAYIDEYLDGYGTVD